MKLLLSFQSVGAHETAEEDVDVDLFASTTSSNNKTEPAKPSEKNLNEKLLDIWSLLRRQRVLLEVGNTRLSRKN